MTKGHSPLQTAKHTHVPVYLKKEAKKERSERKKQKQTNKTKQNKESEKEKNRGALVPAE
jgi:hypothetical protein